MSGSKSLLLYPGDLPVSSGPPRAAESVMVCAPARGQLVAAAFRRWHSIAVAVAALVFALPIGAAGFPVVAMAILGAGAGVWATLFVRDLLGSELAARVYGPLGPPIEPEVQVHELGSLELASSYADLLNTYEQIRVFLRASPVLVATFGGLYARLSELVQLAGRVARNGLRLRAYLDADNPENLAAAAAQLDDRADATHNEDAARTFRLAAVSRRRQLSTYRDIEGLYDSVVARLAILAALFGVVEARLVELEAVDDEQSAAVGLELTEEIQEVEEELELLGSSVETALA